MVTEEFARKKFQKGIQYNHQPIYGIVKVEADGREPELMVGIPKEPYIIFIPISGITEKDFVGKTQSF